MNKEKYQDPTAEQAIGNVTLEEKSHEKDKVNAVMKIFKLALWLAGMEMVDRVKIRDKKSGRTWL